MDYGEMSDRELNQCIADKLSLRWVVSSNCVKQSSIMVLDQSSRSIIWIEKDFINNWSVMGPIIEGNAISVTPIFEDDNLRPKPTRWVAQKQAQSIAVKDKSPLRAAAICYLEMD